MNAHAMANAVQGLIDEIWQDILYAGADYNRADARSLYFHSWPASSLGIRHAGQPEQTTRLEPRRQNPAHRQGGREQLAALASLFDAYRQFYQREPDLALARRFLGQNLAKATLGNIPRGGPGDTALGFAQLCQAGAQ